MMCFKVQKEFFLLFFLFLAAIDIHADENITNHYLQITGNKGTSGANGATGSGGSGASWGNNPNGGTGGIGANGSRGGAGGDGTATGGGKSVTSGNYSFTGSIVYDNNTALGIGGQGGTGGTGGYGGGGGGGAQAYGAYGPGTGGNGGNGGDGGTGGNGGNGYASGGGLYVSNATVNFSNANVVFSNNKSLAEVGINGVGGPAGIGGGGGGGGAKSSGGISGRNGGGGNGSTGGKGGGGSGNIYDGGSGGAAGSDGGGGEDGKAGGKAGANGNMGSNGNPGTIALSKGGAICLQSGTINFSQSAISFSANTASALSGAYGGAIYVASGNLNFNSGTTITFTNNVDSQGNVQIWKDGGAINFNSGSIVEFKGNSVNNLKFINTWNNVVWNVDEVKFTDNKVGSRGLSGIMSDFWTVIINSQGKSITAIGNANTATVSGNGGFMNLQNLSSELTLSGKVKINSNTSAANGGAIYINSGKAITFKGNVELIDNKAPNGRGGAIYNTGTLNINPDINKEVLFSSNTALTGGADIWTTGTDSSLSFSGAGTVNIESGIGGTGNIFKAGTGNLHLKGDNSLHNGVFLQSAGTTYVSGKYFTGISSITGGTLSIDNGAIINKSEIGIWNSSTKMIVTANNNLEFVGTIKGNGQISKTGSATLTISSGNYGDFIGIYNQDAGHLIIKTITFNTLYNINNGTVDLKDNAEILNNTAFNLERGGELFVSSNGDFEWIKDRIKGEGSFTKTGTGTITITGSNELFTGNFTLNKGKLVVCSTYFAGLSKITNGSSLEFREHSKITPATQFQVTKATMTITDYDGDFILSENTLSGNGLVIKNNEKDMYVLDDNSLFVGTFIQNRGNVIVSGAYFSGVSSITNGTLLDFKDNSTISTSTQLQIWKSTVSISDVNNDLTLGVNAISGDGLVIKSADIVLKLIGDSKNFNGTYIQTAGTTTVEGNGSYFVGVSSIFASTLEIKNKGKITSGKIVGINADIACYEANIDNNRINLLQFQTVQNSSVLFSGSTITISKNSVKSFDIKDSSICLKNSSITFNSNNDSAIFLENTIANIESTFMSFINNRSNKGGAIYAQGSTVTISGCGINFSSNTAISSGAAIYLKNSSMTIETKGGNIFFENNRMGETPNDIFLDENSKLYFSIDDNKSIALKNGFLSAQQGLETQIFKTGNGILELGGKNIVNGRFSSTDGTVKLLANASYVGKELYFKDSVFDMTDNTAANNMNVVNVATFTSLTDLRMDVNTHSDINRRSDRIIASSVTLSGKLYLNVAKGNYKDGIWFHLIDSSGNNISGKYSDENVESGDVWCTVDNKDPNSLKIFLRGVVPSTFSSIPGLTYNQKAVAEALDLGSASDMKEELLDVVNMIDKLPTDSIKKKALESMNGYFLANAIKSVTYGSYVTDDVLYAREKIEHLRIWGQTVGRNRAKEKYNDNSWGMVIGADKEIRENIIAGTYGVYEANNITQEQNRAETDNVGVGIYGGYMVDENWMVKTSVNAMYNSYETNRSIGLGRYLVGYDEDKISHANFKGFALGIDIQSSLRMHLTESVEIRPYMAIEQKSVIYGSFKENGNEKQGLDLSVKRGLYLKRAMRLGIGAHRNKDKILSGYIKCEGQILIDEKGNAIESALTGEPTKKFKSEGYAQNRFLMGIGIGGTVEISDNLKLFADGQFNMGKSYIDLYGNAGIRYSIFAKKKRSKKPKITSSDFQKLYRLLE